MNNFHEGNFSIWATEVRVLKLQTWRSDFCKLQSCCGVSKIWKYSTVSLFWILDMLWKRWWGTTSMKKVCWSEQEKMEFRSSQQVWRVNRKLMNSYSSYLNFWSCTTPMDLKFGDVVVHKIRNNFHEDDFAIWAIENGVILHPLRLISGNEKQFHQRKDEKERKATNCTWSCLVNSMQHQTHKSWKYF